MRSMLDALEADNAEEEDLAHETAKILGLVDDGDTGTLLPNFIMDLPVGGKPLNPHKQWEPGAKTVSK